MQIRRGMAASTCVCEEKCHSRYIPKYSNLKHVFRNPHLYLCDPSQLCAELREGGMFLRLNISMKFRLDLPCGGIQQNSREFN